MGRLITGIVVLALVTFALIGVLADPADTLSGEESLGGIVFVCFMLVGGVMLVYSMLFGGVMLVYSGTRFIARRRRTMECALQMLRKSDKVDACEIADHLGVGETRVVKFLNYGRNKGILPGLDGGVT
jgi:hypothetical protein